MDELGLSGVALRVYALIYSFTKAGSDCHGSVRYISERTGSAKSSVHRAINELLDKKYITKLDSNGRKTCRYIATNSLLSQNGTVNVPKSDTTVSKWDTDSPKIGDNNKENNKEILTNYDIFDAMTSNDPKGHFGRSRVVRLSYHQYVTLLLRVGFSETFRYIRILEGRILDNPDSVYRNHYKTIVGWAREDGYIDEIAS